MKKLLLIFYILLTICSNLVYGHSGGTDSKGGHHDRINGGYHYHHGMSVHQHRNGVCSYRDNESSSSSNILWFLVGGICATLLFFFSLIREEKESKEKLKSILFIVGMGIVLGFIIWLIFG